MATGPSPAKSLAAEVERLQVRNQWVGAAPRPGPCATVAVVRIARAAVGGAHRRLGWRVQADVRDHSAASNALVHTTGQHRSDR